MKNIHVLPTDKPSRLAYDFYEKFYLLSEDAQFFEFQNLVQNRELYITSDEVIKEGDWFYDLDTKYIKIKQSWENSHLDFNAKKIILTTDQDLIKDGVQAIDDEFLQWFVSKANDSGKPIDIVEVRKEKYSERFDNDKSPIGNPDTWGNRWVLVFPKESPTIVDKLKEYFENTSEEQIQKDWDETCEKTKGINSPTVKEFLEKQKQHLIDMMEKDEELGLYDYGWCKGNIVLPKEYPGEYDETQAKQVSQLAKEIKLEDVFNDEKRQGVKELIDKHKQETLEKMPTELKPVLAKISHINDLGKSEWYEVVYYNNKWCSYSGSKTFQDGERVLEWKYCKDLI